MDHIIDNNKNEVIDIPIDSSNTAQSLSGNPSDTLGHKRFPCVFFKVYLDGLFVYLCQDMFSQYMSWKKYVLRDIHKRGFHIILGCCPIVVSFISALNLKEDGAYSFYIHVIFKHDYPNGDNIIRQVNQYQAYDDAILGLLDIKNKLDSEEYLKGLLNSCVDNNL